jgi:hypothetical protein
MHSMVHSHYWPGAAYPRGGAAELARRIIPTIEQVCDEQLSLRAHMYVYMHAACIVPSVGGFLL